MSASCSALLHCSVAFMCFCVCWFPRRGGKQSSRRQKMENRGQTDKKRCAGKWGNTLCAHFSQHCHLNPLSETEPGFIAGLQLKTNYYLWDWRRMAESDTELATWTECDKHRVTWAITGQHLVKIVVSWQNVRECELREASLKAAPSCQWLPIREQYCVDPCI